ncbi:MAG: TonB-dependent receptor [Prevotella sp.]|nr:TonB-dependent receptor [Prevotella sp.]
MFKPVSFKRDVIVFKQFSRKGYALFAVLGRVVLIGTLSVATLSNAKASSISVSPIQNDSATQRHSKDILLDEVSITGARAPLTARQSARIVTVITREDIQRVAAASVNDLLKQTTGVDVRQRGGFGVQTDISINGGTFDQITILLNGVNISNPQTGHNAADFPVSLQDIERIEILEGASARIFGSSAFSGAINIVTRADSESNVRVSAEGGSFGTFGGSAAVSHALQQSSYRLHNQLSGGYLQTDGGTDNSDFKKRRGFYQGDYTNRLMHLQWQAGITSQDYGANTFYSAAYPNQYEETRRYIASVNAQFVLMDSRLIIQPTLYWNRSTDHYQLIRGEVGASNGENYHRMDVYGGAINAHLTWALGKTSVGADIRREHILSTAYGEVLPESQWKQAWDSERVYDKEGRRTNTSLFIEHNVLLDRVTISAGLLANKNTGLDGDFRFYPGVDVSYRPTEHWKLFASFNKALRVPTYTDLYTSNRAQRGDTNLKPERNTTYKLGAQYGGRLLTLNAQFFYSRGRNMIDWVYETETATQYHALNIGELDNIGVSADAKFDLKPLHTPLTAFAIGYAYIHQTHETEHQIFKSLYALEYLRHKLTARLDHHIVSHLSATWQLRWQERMNGYHPYWKLDAKLQWTAPSYSLYVQADNLTAHRYYDIGGVRQPGLWLMAGGSIRLKL